MIYGMTDDEIVEAMQQLATENEILNAKLAKAVDTLMFYGGVMPNAFLPIQDGGEKARTTLAEIDSSEAVTPYGLEGEKT
jgi:hypothetical protein